MALVRGSGRVRAQPPTLSRISDRESLVRRVSDDYGETRRSYRANKAQPRTRSTFADYQCGFRMVPLLQSPVRRSHRTIAENLGIGAELSCHALDSWARLQENGALRNGY